MARDAVLYAVLGTIAAHADGIHGYRIKRELDGEIWSLKHGQVYRLLERLRAEGLIEGFDQPQIGRPNRRVFKVTRLGERSLARWFLRPPAQEPTTLQDELSLKLLLFGEERPEGSLALIRDQRARNLRRLARLTKRRARLSDDRSVEHLLLRRAETQLRSELAWLDVAEDAIARGGRPAAPTPPT